MIRGHVKPDALSAYLDGQITDRERSEIEEHLQTCEPCRTHLAALRQLVAVLQKADPVQVPDGFRQQVHARVGALPRQPVRSWSPSLWHRSWKAAAAVAAVLIIGLFTATVPREPRPIDRRQAGQEEGTPAKITSAPPVAADQALRAGGPAVSRSPVAPAPYVPPTISGPGVPSLRRVIRTAQVTLEVESVEATASRLTRLAEAAGGFVAGETSSEVNGTPQGSVILRVPAGRFADVLAQVEALGRVLGRRVGGQDVTEEVVDLRARLRNQERYELRLLAFADRATTIADLLAVENQLARVRGEIEQLTARLQYLDRQVDLATIEVSLREKARAGPLWDWTDVSAKARDALSATVRQLLRGVEVLVITLGAVLPVAVLAGVAWLIIRRVRLVRGG